MAKNPNPGHNSIVQALLDLQAEGYGELTINQAIDRLRADKKLSTALQNKWNSHYYPDKSIVYAQTTTSPALMQLSPYAVKILCFLGTNCGQSGQIQVSVPTLIEITGVKKTNLRDAIDELEDCGAIRKIRKAIQRNAPIYFVNPELFNIGQRTKAKSIKYLNGLTQSTKYIINHNDTHYNTQIIREFTEDGPFVYSRITLPDKTKCPQTTAATTMSEDTAKPNFIDSNITTDMINRQSELIDDELSTLF